MKLFIMGCGFVGSKLAKLYKEQGELVTVTTTSPSKVEALKEMASQVLLLDSDFNLKEALVHQDAVLVCAAPKNKEEYEGAFFQTAKRLEDALKENTHVQTLIYTSSCSVYGEKNGQWVDESQSLEPINPQQKILVETEKVYLNRLPSSIKTCILRLGEIYGGERSIELKIEKRVQNKQLACSENYTNLIHIEDISRAIDFALKKKLSGVYNLCNDSHLPRKAFYEKWCEYLNLGPIEFETQSQSPHRGNKRVNNQKIKLSGFEFLHPLAEPLDPVH